MTMRSRTTVASIEQSDHSGVHRTCGAAVTTEYLDSECSSAQKVTRTPGSNHVQTSGIFGLGWTCKKSVLQTPGSHSVQNKGIMNLAVLSSFFFFGLNYHNLDEMLFKKDLEAKSQPPILHLPCESTQGQHTR